MNNSRMALKTTGTTLKPSVAYNPGTLSEEDLESLKMGVAEELWDISNNFVQTNEILGDTFEKIDTLEIDRDTMNAKIEETYKLSVEGDKVLAQKITEVSGELNLESQKLSAMITEEMTIRLEEDKALAQKITNLSADMETGDNLLSSQITETNRVISELDRTTAENKLELESSISSAKDQAKNELADAEKALADAIARGDLEEAERLRKEVERLQGVIDANKADIEAKLSITNTTIAELDKAMAENKLEMEASIKTVGDNANSSNSAAVDKAERELAAARKALADAIANGDAAEAAKLKAEIDRLLGIIDSNKTEIDAKLVITNQTVAELDKALASNKLELEASISTSSGQAVTEATTQAKRDLTAAQTALNKAITDGDKAESDKLKAEIERLTGIIAGNKVDIDAKLNVTNETIADLDKAVASQKTELQAEYNGKFATVNQTLSATVNKLGEVENKWGIEMDANGKISGVSMNNNGNRSDFEIRADKFAFTDTGGGKSGGFSSSGGVTTFNGIINAQGGVFNGTVNAHGGDFNNVVIRENCTVLGTLYADRIVGLPTAIRFHKPETNILGNPNWQDLVVMNYPSSHGRFNMMTMFGGNPVIKMVGDASIQFRVLLNGNVVHSTPTQSAPSTYTSIGGLFGIPVNGGPGGGTVQLQCHVPEHARGGFYFKVDSGILYSAIDNGSFWL